MPRDNDKNNDSRGRRDRPSGGKGRSGAARGPEKKFAKRGFAGKGDGDKRDGERRPYAGKPDGAKSYGKKPYSGSGKPYAGKREGAPPRFNRDDRPRGDTEKRPYTPRGNRPNYNRDDRASPDRDRKSDPGIARATRVIAARAVRRRASRTRNSVTSGPTHPGTAARRSDPIRRAASGLIPIVRKARENLAATKSSLAAPRIATATGGIGARARILVAGIARATRGIVAIQNRGRSAMLLRPITPGAIPAHHVMAREVSTSPVRTA